MAGANAIKTSDATIQWGNVAGGIFTSNLNLLISASAVADTITIGGPSCAGVTIIGPITGALLGNATTSSSCTGNALTSSSCTGNSATTSSASTLSNIPIAVVGTGSTWPVVPRVNSDGAMEIGSYLDFHGVTSDPNDYSLRLTGSVGGLSCSGTFTATAVYNANWNDIADFLEVEPEVQIEFGKTYVYNSGKHRKAEKYCEVGILGIASDTFGFGVGKKEDSVNQLPLAIAGIVLAHVDKVYDSGTPLTCTGGGSLTKMNFWSRVFYPERMVAIFYRQELKGTWNGVIVNNRDWVKII